MFKFLFWRVQIKIIYIGQVRGFEPPGLWLAPPMSPILTKTFFFWDKLFTTFTQFIFKI